MDANNKTHAKDYLLEYKARSTTPPWLAALIQRCIDTNGKITDPDKDSIFTQLLQENKLNVGDHAPSSKIVTATGSEVLNQLSSTDPQQLILKKITHVKGVNALIPNQCITFSPACTVIFGLNGTGKSGYFRILHEIAGGTQHRSILNNIHGQEDGLEVDVEYSLDETNLNYKWQDKNRRGIKPFNRIKVFDSDYLPVFLHERENSVNIEPLGLNLFQVIASTIDDLKKRLEELQREQENLCPDLQPLIDDLHSQDIIRILQEESLSDDNSTVLTDYLSISKEEIAKLEQSVQLKKELEKKNVDDSKKVLNQEKTEFEALKNHLVRLKSSLESLTEHVYAAIPNYVSKKKTRDERAKQFEVLKSVPSQESDEWQTFVESAERYGVTVDQNTFNKDEKCVYCHQPLGEDAVKLTKAYSEYLNDQSQADFRTAENKINTILGSLENIVLDFNISENLKKILTEHKLGQDKNLREGVGQILSEAKKQKEVLIESLKKKNQVNSQFSLELHDISTQLSKMITDRQERIDGLDQSDNQKKEKIEKLNKEIERLQDKQNVSKWKVKIEKYFAVKKKAKGYKNVNNTILTTGITVLGSKAHDELLTDSIRKSFEEELKALGKDVEVTLEKTGAGKGTVRTCLKVLGNDVESILSTGEQKAVCLSLFLGEIESQGGSDPVVFDDPVNSVDHEISDLLAKRLLQVTANRQVVIFTHDKLFYDSLVYWGGNLKNDQGTKSHHVCKNYIVGGCNSAGCHVYTYTVDRESKDRTGRIFERQNESCAYFISKAEEEIKKSYSVSTVSSFLKSAIEHYMDEKIMNNQGLLRDRRRKISIQWDEIKKISIDGTKIDKLKEYWDKLSDRGSHSTQNSTQNPLKAEDFNEIIAFLKT